MSTQIARDIIGGTTRERGSHHIDRDKRRTFIGLDPVLFQLPQPDLILHSHWDQWFLNGAQSWKGQSAARETTCDPLGWLHEGGGLKDSRFSSSGDVRAWSGS